MADSLEKREINTGQVISLMADGYQLLINPVHQERYCLAQLDDYMHLPRHRFPHQPPVILQLEARTSSKDALRGTWGFGFWNDPYSLGFGAGGMSRLMPILPNAAWFFYGSEENHLTLRDDQPGAGFHVQCFRGSRLPSILSLLAVPALPFLLWRATARQLRRLARVIVKEDLKSLDISTGSWHVYSLEWQKEKVIFKVDGGLVYQTQISPQGRLGLVIWIDNQYFRFDPQGNIGFGFLKTPTQQSLLIRHINLISS